MKTPIINLNQVCENNLFVKREDLMPFSFGGNKYRIAQEILEDIEKTKKDLLIGYGNVRSNMCRVLANIAFSKNIPCYIVSPSEEDDLIIKTFNSYLVDDCKAKMIHCSKENVYKTISSLLEKCKKEGYKPYYLYGTAKGKGNEIILAKAYAKVFNEIMVQENDMKIKFDYIFLAAGTGMTYSGLALEKIRQNSSVKLVGISISRNNKKCYEVLNDYLSAYGISNINVEKVIDFSDEYLCGGYGKYDEHIKEIINYSMNKWGMPLDPTYTGKAFYGMLSYLKKHDIKNKNVLFLHTGGTPLFFDYLEGLKNE